MPRKTLLMGNWKMNHTIKETIEFLDGVKENKLVDLAKKKNVILSIAPSYLSLQAAVLHSNGVNISSQDTHYAKSGAYTSNVSCSMLKEIGVSWSLVGHSEKREYDFESSFSCNLKIRELLENKFHVVYCVGETLKQFNNQLTKDVIKEQITTGLMNVDEKDMSNVIIAYEPVWSIGTGNNASKEIAEDVCGYIRQLLSQLYNSKVAEETLILYGGSVKANNIHDYLSQTDVDGALVGGASLKVDSFKELLENI